MRRQDAGGYDGWGKEVGICYRERGVWGRKYVLEN